MNVTVRYTVPKSLSWWIMAVKYQGMAIMEMPCATPDMELAIDKRINARLNFMEGGKLAKHSFVIFGEDWGINKISLLTQPLSQGEGLNCFFFEKVV